METGLTIRVYPIYPQNIFPDKHLPSPTDTLFDNDAF